MTTERLAAPPRPRRQSRDRLWINDEWTPSRGGGTIEVVDPATEEVIGTVPAGTAADVDAAVSAAAAAFPAWSRSSLARRMDVLRRLHSGLTSAARNFADTITAEAGVPVAISRSTQVAFALNVIESYLDLMPTYRFEESMANSLVVREPCGVVGAITPWNVPLLLMVQKVVPAIMAGCTVVLKPSEITPLNAFLLADVLAECGLPPGVFNLVCGDGPTVGEAIATHPDVAAVSLTGSTRAGRRVAELAAATVKRVHLELGGKSANVILPDADLETAVRTGVDQVVFNSGQACLAWSRMLVPMARYDEAVAIAADAAESYRVGDPWDPSTQLGPLVSSAAYDRVRDYLRVGVGEGARLVTGGPDRPAGLTSGYYVRPTVFADVDNDMRIAREEIFGPVLAMIPYVDTDDAVRIANDTIYGLHGAVWAATDERAIEIARRLRTGRVDINGAPLNLVAPFGGYKQSGIGRELGTAGIDEFTELKSIQQPAGSTAGLAAGVRVSRA